MDGRGPGSQGCRLGHEWGQTRYPHRPMRPSVPRGAARSAPPLVLEHGLVAQVGQRFPQTQSGFRSPDAWKQATPSHYPTR
jgi:hypothetical protein